MYRYKDVYTVDFRNIKYYGEVHLLIKESLEFPDYYGENWDAFWDCIVDMAISVKPLRIEIFGLDVVERKFGKDEADIFLKCLKKAKHRSDDKYAHLMTVEIVDGDKRIEIQ